MQDKSSGVRQLAQDCLSELISSGTVTRVHVHAGTRDFQPAVLRSLKPVLDKILDNAGRVRWTRAVPYRPTPPVNGIR